MVIKESNGIHMILKKMTAVFVAKKGANKGEKVNKNKVQRQWNALPCVLRLWKIILFFTKYFIAFYLVSCVEWLFGWRLERSFQESVLSFRNVDPGNEDEDVRLGGKYL